MNNNNRPFLFPKIIEQKIESNTRSYKDKSLSDALYNLAGFMTSWHEDEKRQAISLAREAVLDEVEKKITNQFSANGGRDHNEAIEDCIYEIGQLKITKTK